MIKLYFVEGLPILIGIIIMGKKVAKETINKDDDNKTPK